MVAVASMASPFGWPPISQTASVTRGVLRIRFTFHDFSWVMTSSRSPWGGAQTGVGFGAHALVKVVSSTYCALATSAKVVGTLPTYPAARPALTFSAAK